MGSPMDAQMVYITCAHLAEAETIGAVLVNERLAACVNILPGMRSVYRWQGQVEQAEEVVLIAKSRADLFDSLAVRVRGLHSYATPCIVALPIMAGEPNYLNWIAAETQS